MYDQDTAALIRSAPQLEGLDRDSLPDLLSSAFAQIAAARIRLSEPGNENPKELSSLIEQIRRIAYTNEALVLVTPNREDRSSAAFVAATAHQLCFNADKVFQNLSQPTFIGANSLSSDISAMLLFIIAEATADAAEVSKMVSEETNNPIEKTLILSLKDLANGKLLALRNRAIPSIDSLESNNPGVMAVSALYLKTLEGIQGLANKILLIDNIDGLPNPILIFEQVRDLSLAPEQTFSNDWLQSSASVLSGPHHLASLLIAVGKDLSGSAVTQIPTPPGIDPEKWRENVRRIAKLRPYLWRNHRNAVEEGYLEPGTSAAVGFPTGAGKSVLAELKISTALLAGKDVIFLAPTHALVDQTTQSLKRSFPTASVQRERQDQFGFLTGEEELPSIFVMTPESCLTQMSIDLSVFEDVGLFVFDECHLLHPGDNPNDRRAIDAMLCVLNLSSITGEADFLLLSAMMKNSQSISDWIAELTDRPCLSLSLSWKPTRQLRGSVVYQNQTVLKLKEELLLAKEKASTKNPSKDLRDKLSASPLALFSLKQTWATRNREDYALVNLLNAPIRLGANNYWALTPNAVEVSSSISAASANNGLKTLVFFQTIKNAASAATKISDLLGPVSIKLNSVEEGWLESAITEMGDASHLYLKVENGRVVQPATVHHGLLLPEERYLSESLYKRSSGLNVLTATSTLAQGMNLPSELVIIGEDSRFNEDTERREILKAQELLNAAGRAGRAGENSTGIVLVVPGKVIPIDLDESSIGPHWTELQEIFSQSDQCLDIIDPLAAVLDRVHTSAESAGEIERYTISRLASGQNGENETESLSNTIKSTFGAFLATHEQDDGWLQDRIESAITFFQGQSPETEHELIETQVAASLGLSVELVSRLSNELEKNGPNKDETISDWRRWFFRWLSENPDLLEKVCRPQSLKDLFGKKVYTGLKTDEEKSNHMLPILSKLTGHWMRGESLSELEKALGTPPKKLKMCNGARKFVLRIVPELSYLFGLPALLHERTEAGKEDPAPITAVQMQLGRCVRDGFNSHAKAALNQIFRRARFSRRQLHHHYALVKPYLPPSPSGEIWKQTLDRVEDASDSELNARGNDA